MGVMFTFVFCSPEPNWSLIHHPHEKIVVYTNEVTRLHHAFVPFRKIKNTSLRKINVFQWIIHF